MAIPAKSTGYGNNSTAQNIFRLTYSQALSSAPKWEAYDGGSFPAGSQIWIEEVGSTVCRVRVIGTESIRADLMVSLRDIQRRPGTADRLRLGRTRFK